MPVDPVFNGMIFGYLIKMSYKRDFNKYKE